MNSNWGSNVDFKMLRLPSRIGVCINYGAHIWYQLQSEGEKELANELGIAIEAVDANMDGDVQLSQLGRFLDQGVDALIFSAADPVRAPAMLAEVHAKGIPVITESLWVDSPAVKANVMINDFQGGVKLGERAATWLGAPRPIKVLDITAPWLEEGLQRSDGFLAGLRRSFPVVESVRVDGRADIEISAKVATEVLKDDPGFDVVFGVDDESAIGGRLAFERLGLRLDDVLICSFGFSGPKAYDWLNNGIYHIVCAMFPEYQARMLVCAAVYAYNQRKLPRHIPGPCVALTAAELPNYYIRTADKTILNFDAVRRISTTGEQLVND
jgi:ribose transport system substrate-binding protein